MRKMKHEFDVYCIYLQMNIYIYLICIQLYSYVRTARCLEIVAQHTVRSMLQLPTSLKQFLEMDW